MKYFIINKSFKRKIFLTIAPLFFVVNLLQGQNFVWAKQFSGTNSEYGKSVAIDAFGNVYTTGSFNGTVDFDPGPGVFNLSHSTGGAVHTYISKLDANGNFVWAKDFDGWNNESKSIALDQTGNIYITGFFQQITDFDPGPGVYSLSNSFNSAVFISKLDNNGNFIWAKKIEGLTNINDSYSYDMGIDPSGNVCITGMFKAIADFDPGPGVFTLTPTGQEDTFIFKLDANGNFMWAKLIGGNAYSAGNGITTDANESIYTTGYFSGTVDFDPGSGVFNISSVSGQRDIYILKLDVNGNFMWVKPIGALSNEAGIAIVIDGSGNVITTGTFQNIVDFDPGAGVYNLSSAGNLDIFVLKLDNNGNFIWAGGMGGPQLDRGLSITTDLLGNIYTTGAFQSISDFNPGSGVLNFTSFGSTDIFITKFDPAGILIWASQMGGLSGDQCFSIKVNASGNIYTTGQFSNTADFDPGTGVFNLIGLGGAGDSYVHKMNGCLNSTVSTITTSACFSYTLNNQTYTSSGVYTQLLINTAGCDSVLILNLTINGSNDTLNVIACDSYTWNSQTYTLTGFYRDTLTGVSGCDSIINLDLIIKYAVSSNINVAICQGQSYFGHTTTGTYIDTYVAANGCDSVRTLNLLVKPKSVSTINASICEGQNYSGHTLAGTYIDTLIAANGCDSIRTLNLIVKPKKLTTVNASICQGQSYFAGGANQISSGIYKDTLISQLACDSIVTTNLLVNPKPIPNLGQDKNLCSGKTITLNPGVFATYSWQDLSTLPNFVVINTGTYWVTVTDNNNCSASDTLEIKNILPLPSNFLRPTDSICQYEKLKIQPLNSYASYLWSTGSTQPTITVENPGRYILTVQDVNGCTGSDTTDTFQKKCFSAVLFPTAFSPNGDQLNNVFRPNVYGTLISFRLEVYDRSGQIVFRTSDPQKGWNGIHGGIPSQTAVFIWQCFYQLQGGSLEYQKGTVTVIR